MINIKISTDSPTWPLSRQIPDSNEILGDYKFWINTNVKECDWWFVYEGLLQSEVTYCDPKHVVLITGEPPATRIYDPKFLAQFSSIITSHTDLPHQNAVIMQQALPWHIGVKRDAGNNVLSYLSYDDLVGTQNKNINKTKLASVISSNKKNTKGHRQRICFIEQLRKHMGGQIDFYGRGFNDIEDKWDAIAPYKYHIVLENSSVQHYFTEKLSDSFLGGAYPIYYGCPNIFDYFSPFSLSTIDINRPQQAIDSINKIFTEKTFENSFSYIEQAKELALNHYNLFALMSKYSNRVSAKKKERIELFPEHGTSKLHSRVMKSYRKLRHYGLKKAINTLLEKYD